MDIEALVNRAYTSWVYGKGTAWTDHMRSALTELAAGYEQKIAGLESEAILSRALSERIRQLERLRKECEQVREAAMELKDVCSRPSAARTRAEAWRALDKAIKAAAPAKEGEGMK